MVSARVGELYEDCITSVKEARSNQTFAVSLACITGHDAGVCAGGRLMKSMYLRLPDRSRTLAVTAAFHVSY